MADRAAIHDLLQAGSYWGAVPVLVLCTVNTCRVCWEGAIHCVVKSTALSSCGDSVGVPRFAVPPLLPLNYACTATIHCVSHVYSWCMSRVRTNIELEDTYIQIIMERYRVRTKTEAVDLALRHLAGQPMTREEALAMEGAEAIGQLPPDVAPSDL